MMKWLNFNRCKSFQNTKRGEICRIPGCTVTPSVGGQPIPIRMPHVQPETFRRFIQYLLLQDSGVFEMMTLAADLGVEDLRAACEDHGPPKLQKVMVQPINLIFRYLQNRSRVQIWLYENVNLRLEGHIVGFDEYMNIVLDEAEEYHVKTKNRRQIGRIMMKGDNITLIQNVNPGATTSASSFMERCITFIGDNAADCVKTNAFLNLPKEALIKLISSDF
ncbi:Small nuclear ribonucleoprotein E, partial [Operophtera brumata]